MKSSNLIRRILVALTLPVAGVVAAWAAGAFDVTATIYNYNGITPYTLQSDGNTSATYSGDFTPSTGGGGTDYYQLDLALSKSRSYVLTLNPLNSNSAAAAPFTGPIAFPGGILYSRCFTSTGGYQDWTQMRPGYPDGNCSMRANFTYNGVNYILVMSPEPQYKGTGTATVTCTSWSSSAKSCVAWTDVPNPGATNPNVAFLLNKSNGEAYVGSYSLSFNVTLTHP